MSDIPRVVLQLLLIIQLIPSLCYRLYSRWPSLGLRKTIRQCTQFISCSDLCWRESNSLTRWRTAIIDVSARRTRRIDATDGASSDLITDENVFNISDVDFQLIESLGAGSADRTAFNALLRDCARRGDRNTAEAIVRRMSLLDVEPTRSSYEYLIMALLNSRFSVLDSDSGSHHGAESDRVSMSAATAATAFDAEAVLLSMLRAGYAPSSVAAAAVIEAAAAAEAFSTSRGMTWGNANVGRMPTSMPGYPERAELLFDRLSLLSDTKGASDADMDLPLYNALIFAWNVAPIKGIGENGNSYEYIISHASNILAPAAALTTASAYLSRAEAVLHRMRYVSLQPNARTFELLLGALVRCHRPDAAVRAWHLYRQAVGDMHVASGTTLSTEELPMLDDAETQSAWARLNLIWSKERNRTTSEKHATSDPEGSIGVDGVPALGGHVGQSPSKRLCELVLQACAQDRTTPLSATQAIVRLVLLDMKGLYPLNRTDAVASSKPASYFPLSQRAYVSALRVHARDCTSSFAGMRALEQLHTAMEQDSLRSAGVINHSVALPLLVCR